MSILMWFVGAVGGVVVQSLLLTFSARYAERWRSTMAHFQRILGRSSRRKLGAKPRLSGELPSYFREGGDAIVDLVVYELSLRPLIPLMDLLYFEYLRRRLEVGTVKKVVVVPWSGWSRSDENLQKEHDLLQNLKIVFGEEFGRVKVLSGADFQPYAKSLLREEFFDSLESLGRSEFLRSSSRIMGYPFRSYHDINSGHPESVQSRSLVEHSLRGWLVLKYLQDNELQSGDIRCIGALMWERELTKLLLLKNLEASTGVRPALLLGKSITFWQSGRKPIPTFESEAIEVFGDFDEQVTKLTRKSIAELARTRELLEAILESRAFELTLRESAPHVAPRPALRRSVEQTADLLSQLQSRLGG